MIPRIMLATVLAAGACAAQTTALEADARAVAEKQIAMIKLQQKQTRSNGPQQTPEQDRIDNDIAADYQFIQERSARWKGSQTRAAFLAAVKMAMRDPSLRSEDPFKVSEAKPPAPRTDGSGPVIDWGQVAFAAAFLTALVFAACFVVLRGTIFGLGLISKIKPDRLRGGGAPGPMPSFPRSSSSAGGGAPDPMPLFPQPSSSAGGDGSWGRICPGCNGAATLMCPMCAGSGQRWDGTGTVVCLSCGGFKTRPCGTCGGVGRVAW